MKILGISITSILLLLISTKFRSTVAATCVCREDSIEVDRKSDKSIKPRLFSGGSLFSDDEAGEANIELEGGLGVGGRVAGNHGASVRFGTGLGSRAQTVDYNGVNFQSKGNFGVAADGRVYGGAYGGAYGEVYGEAGTNGILRRKNKRKHSCRNKNRFRKIHRKQNREMNSEGNIYVYKNVASPGVQMENSQSSGLSTAHAVYPSYKVSIDKESSGGRGAATSNFGGLYKSSDAGSLNNRDDYQFTLNGGFPSGHSHYRSGLELDEDSSSDSGHRTVQVSSGLNSGRTMQRGYKALGNIDSENVEFFTSSNSPSRQSKYNYEYAKNTEPVERIRTTGVSARLRGTGDSNILGSTRFSGIGDSNIGGSTRLRGTGYSNTGGSTRFSGIGDSNIGGSIRFSGIGDSNIGGSTRLRGTGDSNVAFGSRNGYYDNDNGMIATTDYSGNGNRPLGKPECKHVKDISLKQQEDAYRNQHKQTESNHPIDPISRELVLKKLITPQSVYYSSKEQGSDSFNNQKLNQMKKVPIPYNSTNIDHDHVAADGKLHRSDKDVLELDLKNGAVMKNFGIKDDKLTYSNFGYKPASENNHANEKQQVAWNTNQLGGQFRNYNPNGFVYSPYIGGPNGFVYPHYIGGPHMAYPIARYGYPNMNPSLSINRYGYPNNMNPSLSGGFRVTTNGNPDVNSRVICNQVPPGAPGTQYIVPISYEGSIYGANYPYHADRIQQAKGSHPISLGGNSFGRIRSNLPVSTRGDDDVDDDVESDDDCDETFK